MMTIEDDLPSIERGEKVSRMLRDIVFDLFGIKHESADISVIIPVYNDPDGLKTTIRSLLSQTIDDFEIIIANNGSTDETTAICERFADGCRIHHVSEDDIQSSYAARNAGIEKATGDILAFLDADMWVESDYIERIQQEMVENSRYYMGCRVEIITDGGSIARYNKVTGFQVESYIREKKFAPTCCLVVHREVFDTVGKFDERLESSGDSEFGRRVNEAGFNLHYEPTIMVYHPARSTLSNILSKEKRIGRGFEQVLRYHNNRFSFRSLSDPRNYLPPHPAMFLNNEAKQAKSKKEAIYWYIISYIRRLYKVRGRWGERVENMGH